MKSRIENLWYWLRSSFWFVPSLMVCGAVVLAAGCLHLDERYPIQTGIGEWWAFQGGLDGARAILSTIASSMITVAGVVFSITIVVLSLASSQFGPRLIRNFMNDRSSQVVLGTFISAYVYCLLVLRSFGAEPEEAFARFFSINVSFLLALAGIGVLIFFIHRISSSIQANNVVARVCGQLDEAILRLYPEEMGEGDGDVEDGPPVPDPSEWKEALVVEARSSGYVQRIDVEGLMELAGANDLVVSLSARPGDFVTKGGELAKVDGDGSTAEEVKKAFSGSFILGPERTTEQDVEYAVSQLVEIAVRALSPGVNDPFTAITCIDWIGVALSTIAGRKFPASTRLDDEGRLRVIARVFTFGGLADASLNQIRQNAAAIPAVSIHMLDMLTSIGGGLRRSSDRGDLLRHCRMIHDGCRRNCSEGYDIECLDAAFHRALSVLDSTASKTPSGGASKTAEIPPILQPKAGGP
ncbi:MAG: DUF2254 domain-containing protein [Desulfobacterales bacterium]